MTKTKWYAKAIYLLVAVALVLGFTLVPVTAQPVNATAPSLVSFKLEAYSGCTADWNTSEQKNGLSSVELYNPDGDDDANYAEVAFAVTPAITLNDIDMATTYFWCKTASASTPYFIFELQGGDRINTDAAAGADYAGWAKYLASSTPQWQWDDGSWHSLADTLTEYGTLTVTKVLVELSGLADGAYTAYVDDITVDGTTYVTEPIALNKAWYKTGETVNITANIGNTSGVIALYAWSNTTGADGKITVAGTETGSGTGIFAGSFTLVNTTPGPGQLLVNNGDTVTVYYTPVATAVATATVDNIAPTIAVVSPTAGFKTTDTKPPIEASYTDASSGIDASTVVMKLDTVAVTPQTKTTAHVVYTPATAIGQGNHTVTVDVSDVAGNAATQKSWSFTVDNVKPVISGQVATPPVVKPTPTGVSPIVFTAHVVDATSGVATVTIDCSSLTPAGGAALAMYDDGTHGDVTLGDGTYTLAYVNNITAENTYTLPVNATDNADNAATTKNITLVVSSDTTPPVITSPAITYPFALASARSRDTVTISATVTDDVGVSSVTATCAGLTGTPVTLVNTIGNLWSWTGTVASVTSPITITAQDAKTNTATDTSLSLVVDPDITGYVINLNPGWNFISLPLIPGVPSEDTAIASVLSGVGNIAHVTRVDYYYNTGTSTGWQTYMPGAGGTLATMEDGKGYWMWMSAADTLTVKGRIMPAAPALPHTYPVYGGWNAIGFKSLADKENQLYLAGLTYTVMWEYNTATGYTLIYPPTTTHMNVGHGYWLWLATASGTIVPP